MGRPPVVPAVAALAVMEIHHRQAPCWKDRTFNLVCGEGIKMDACISAAVWLHIHWVEFIARF